jgi:hypothetical protein
MNLQLKFVFLALVVVGCAALLSGQTSLGSGPTLFPSPQHQKMDYFAGAWSLQGTMKPGPNAPGGSFTSTEHGEWVSGGFFLETHSSMDSAAGNTRGVRMMEYDAEGKVYTDNAYNSLGEHLMATGHVSDNSWTWTSEATRNGQIVKGRYTITVVSPLAYTFKYESQTSPGEWSLVIEGKATRSP